MVRVNARYCIAQRRNCMRVDILIWFVRGLQKLSHPSVNWVASFWYSQSRSALRLLRT
jgi:hypothetical protein